jgi:pimeloyl-ACP methyl ester carboxylesterase
MLWTDDRPFEKKFQKLLTEIDRLAGQGQKISLVGVSAGASAALSAFAKRKNSISGMVCICGKIQNSQNVQESTYTQNPSFRESMQQLDKNLPNLGQAERKKILSIHPLKDNIVPPADTKIDGTREKIIPTFGHVFSITCAITFGSFGIVGFLKKFAKNS